MPVAVPVYGRVPSIRQFQTVVDIILTAEHEACKDEIAACEACEMLTDFRKSLTVVDGYECEITDVDQGVRSGI